MQNLVRIIDDVKAVLKAEYLSDPDQIWEKPYAVAIEPDGVAILGRGDDNKLVEGIRDGLSRGKLEGIVIGRMVAQYSDRIKDARGNRQLLKKAILITGRMLATSQTYVTIIPCYEHKDLRNPLGDTVANAEPKPLDTPNLVTASPDKVEKIISPGGHVGFKSIQFGREDVYDSRLGVRCNLDPIISGVLENPNNASA